jgi:hypothetical protein
MDCNRARSCSIGKIKVIPLSFEIVDFCLSLRRTSMLIESTQICHKGKLSSVDSNMDGQGKYKNYVTNLRNLQNALKALHKKADINDLALAQYW